MPAFANTIQSQPAKQLPVFPQLDGIFVLDKPAGPSSAQCLKVFKRMGQKKVGHGGTLDPMASGVLLVLLGQATKISGYLLEGGAKTYTGVLRLGMTTDTWDAEGHIVSENPYDLNEDDIKTEINAWTRLEEQLVPPFSAAKSQGKPLYKLARSGKDVPVKVKKINIFKADLLEIGLPYVRFRVSCSSGAYIRSLAHSLGVRLGCGAALWELTRDYSHPFGLSEACPLQELYGNPALLQEKIKPIEEALPGLPQIELTMEEAAGVLNGKAVAASGEFADGQSCILRKSGKALALGRFSSDWGKPCWTIARGLWN